MRASDFFCPIYSGVSPARATNLTMTFFVSSIRLKRIGDHGNKLYVKYMCGNDQRSKDDYVHRIRTWFFTDDLHEATDYVRKDRAGLSEGGGELLWAVIESLEYGIHEKSGVQKFFRWDMDREAFMLEEFGWPDALRDYYKKNMLVRRIAQVG